MSASNDSADLEALFDSIATDYHVPPEPAPAPPAPAVSIPSIGDSDELQALFDSVAAEAPQPADDAGAAAEATWPQQEDVF